MIRCLSKILCTVQTRIYKLYPVWNGLYQSNPKTHVKDNTTLTPATRALLACLHLARRRRPLVRTTKTTTTRRTMCLTRLRWPLTSLSTGLTSSTPPGLSLSSHTCVAAALLTLSTKGMLLLLSTNDTNWGQTDKAKRT